MVGNKIGQSEMLLDKERMGSVDDRVHLRIGRLKGIYEGSVRLT